METQKWREKQYMQYYSTKKNTVFLFSKTKDWLVSIILLVYISGTEDFLIC